MLNTVNPLSLELFARNLQIKYYSYEDLLLMKCAISGTLREKRVNFTCLCILKSGLRHYLGYNSPSAKGRQTHSVLPHPDEKVKMSSSFASSAIMQRQAHPLPFEEHIAAGIYATQFNCID